MAVGTVAAFWAVSILFVLTPGADWAYAITAGLRNQSIVPAVGGLLSGHLLMTAVVAAGVAALVAQTPIVLTLLTVAGTAYLIWLGVMMLVRHSSPPQAAVAGVPQSWVRQALTGLGISGLNPKVLLLFLALLPQFTDPGASWSLATQIVLLGCSAYGQLCGGLHRGGDGCPRGAAHPPRGGTGSDLDFRCRNDRDRCGVVDREGHGIGPSAVAVDQYEIGVGKVPLLQDHRERHSLVDYHAAGRPLSCSQYRR